MSSCQFRTPTARWTECSYRSIERAGPAMLEDRAIRFRFTSSAGQSFGTLARARRDTGVEGDAADYVSKGLFRRPHHHLSAEIERFPACGAGPHRQPRALRRHFWRMPLRDIAAERCCVRHFRTDTVIEGAEAVNPFEISRMTNAFSKRAEKARSNGCPFFLHYNFCFNHQMLMREIPAMEAGIETIVRNCE